MGCVGWSSISGGISTALNAQEAGKDKAEDLTKSSIEELVRIGGHRLRSLKLGDKHRLILGSESCGNLQQDQRNSDVDPFCCHLDNRRSSQFLGFYLQDEYAILKRLTINTGVRYDHYDSIGGTAHPRLGPIYGSRQQTVIKVLHGGDFRAPNVYELFYGDGISQKGNPDLNPETSKTAELGLDHHLREHLRFSASSFRNRINGLINQETDPADEFLVFTNLEDVSFKELELEMEGKRANGLKEKS